MSLVDSHGWLSSESIQRNQLAEINTVTFDRELGPFLRNLLRFWGKPPFPTLHNLCLLPSSPVQFVPRESAYEGRCEREMGTPRFAWSLALSDLRKTVEREGTGGFRASSISFPPPFSLTFSTTTTSLLSSSDLSKGGYDNFESSSRSHFTPFHTHVLERVFRDCCCLNTSRRPKADDLHNFVFVILFF